MVGEPGATRETSTAISWVVLPSLTVRVPVYCPAPPTAALSIPTVNVVGAVAETLPLAGARVNQGGPEAVHLLLFKPVKERRTPWSAIGSPTKPPKFNCLRLTWSAPSAETTVSFTGRVMVVPVALSVRVISLSCTPTGRLALAGVTEMSICIPSGSH